MILFELFKKVSFEDIWIFISTIYSVDDEFRLELEEFYESIMIEEATSSNLILIGEEFYEYEENEEHTFQVEKYFELLCYHLNRRTLMDVSDENLNKILSSRIYEKSLQKFGSILLAAHILVELYDLLKDEMKEEDIREIDRLLAMIDDDLECRELNHYDHQMKSYYLNKNKQIEKKLKSALEQDFPLIG